MPANFKFFRSSSGEPFESSRLLSADSPAPVNAEVGASASGFDGKAFRRKLRSNVFSDADDGGDDTRLVGDVEAELLDTCSKGFASAHARFDNSRLGGLSALVHIVDP